MGWSIVRQEASDDPKRYSRLWLPQDISQLLIGSEGTEKIEGITFNLQAAANVEVSSEAFTHMTKLRLLKFHNANVSQVPNFLPGELRWLHWHGYPSKILPVSFQGQKLVGLKMQYSRLIQLWKGLKVLNNLKFMNLSHSQKLIRIPDFTGIPNLERLILKECTSLVEIHASIGFLKNLVLLNLNHCVNLKRLPESIHLEKLETMILSGCLKLENFPKIAAPMACLLEVHAEATAVRELPSSIEWLTNLRLIDLGYCKHLVSLPNSICRLKGLQTLILSGCSNFGKLPDDLGQMEGLAELYCDDTAIQEPPSSFSLLKKLKFLTFRGCKPLASQSQRSLFLSRLLQPRTFQDIKASPYVSLSGLSSLVQLDISCCSMFDGGICCDLGELPSLQVLNLSKNKFVSIPAESLAHLTGLKKLDLVGCYRLETLPDLPSSIKEVYLDECKALRGNIDMFTKYPKLSRISFTRCIQLLQNPRYSDVVDAIWQHLLKGLSVADRHCSVFFPGNSVPEWFIYKNLGLSISANLPQNWYNDKFMGFAICVPDVRSITCVCSYDVSEKYGIEVVFGYRSHDGDENCVLTFIGMVGSEEYMVSERSCLAYLSYGSLILPGCEDPNEWSQIVVEGVGDYEGIGGYGLQLVYEDDVKQAQDQAVELLMIQNDSS
nr:TMV resistance protein N-like [Ipomoea batatas]